jgi:apolipoprotein N-acyltransferase
VLAGVALALSFHKTNIAGIAWIAPGLMLFAGQRGKSFWLGYLAGFTHYLISLSWLLKIPVKFYPILGWISLCAYLALFPAAWVWVCTRVGKSETAQSSWLRRTVLALFCAVAWVAMEMAVARVFTGFPWNLLGASQQRLLPLIQFASLTGVYGVAFLVVWFSASLLNAVNGLKVQPSQRQIWLKELAFPILTVAVVYALGLHAIRSHPKPARTLRAALIQPSIPQTMIWNAADAGVRFAELIRLTESALTNKPAVVIWPEAALPRPVRDDLEMQRAIARLAITNGAWLIIGSDDFDLRGTNEVYFNSSFLVTPRGELISTYRKRRLVIFGEYIPLYDYIPFVKYLTPITGGFTPGDGPVTFDLGDLKARTSVLICFEDTFPHYAREHAVEDIDFLVNITNDGWFGDSAAHWQHAANAAFRAVENGLPLVRCSNNGITCWIDQFGGLNDIFLGQSGGVYGPGFKIIEIPIAATRARTFYNRYGDVFGWCCVAITLSVLALRTTFRKRG